MNNTKIINIGVGKEGVKSSSVGGFYIAVFFSITLDTVNWIFKDNYRWTNWLGTVSTDIVKSLIGVLAAIVWGGMVAGASAVTLTLFSGIVVGLVVGGVLNYFDERLHVTDSIIKFLNYVDKKTPLLVNEFYKAYVTEFGEVKDFVKSNIDKIGKFYSNATIQGLMF